MNRLAAVVIGRNEFEKLPRCLSSVVGQAEAVVFVDSGSEDGSGDLARGVGVDVVELDRSAPFTVARARNAGLAWVLAQAPGSEFIQFVDADSEMVPSWYGHASSTLAAHADVAVVFGRVRERHPHRSVYTRLYQTEFDVHFRQADVCGGMALMRIRALHQVGGFNPSMCGFEDSELSWRLRRAGWRVLRLDADMAVHETGMKRFAQWWARQLRSGYARAHEAALHGKPVPRYYGTREWCSIWFWGSLLPLLAIAGTGPTHGMSLAFSAAYAVLFLRIHRRMRRRGTAALDAALYAASCVLGKFPQAVGMIRFHAEKFGPSGLRVRHL